MSADFSFQVDLTNVAPSGTYVQIPEMALKGKITALIANAHKDEAGARVAKFTITVTEPGYEGAQRFINMRLPDATEKGQSVRPLWRAVLESIGFGPAQLDNGTLNLGPATFIGKEGHFWHKPRPEGSKKEDNLYDDLSFLTPAAYADRKKQMAHRPAGAAQPQVNGGGASVSGPAQPLQAPAQAPLDTQALKANLLT